MRRFATLCAAPLAALLFTAPAVAAPRDSERVEDARDIARELERSPAVANMPAVLGAITDALLDLPVGRIAAALEGDPSPSREEAERTVADIGEATDPDFRERTRDQVRASAAGARAATGAIARTLPEIARSADVLEGELARIARTLPLPSGY